MSADRAAIVRKIDDLLDGHCKTCTIRTDYNREYGGNTSFITQHCSKVCPIGLELAEFGQELIGKVRPRKQIKLEVEEVMAKSKLNISAEEYFAERQAGKSIAQIAEEQNVSEATIYNHMNKWAEEGKVQGGAEESRKLLREKDAAPASELKQLEKAVQEIERLTAEVEKWKAQAGETKAHAEREHDVLQTEVNRMITERDELIREIDELQREKTGWIENERILNHLVDQLRSDLQKRQTEPQLADKPSEVQLLDRSIADLTRARWILNRLTASGE